jgi:IS605 OrfB family transposase
VERALFQEQHVKGRSSSEVKKEFLSDYRITGRHFNSVQRELDGSIQSARAAQERHREQTEGRTQALKRSLKKLEEKLSREQEKERKAQEKAAKAALQSASAAPATATAPAPAAQEPPGAAPSRNPRRERRREKREQTRPKRSRAESLCEAIHHKKRKLAALTTKLDALEARLAQGGPPRLCFGSNRLFRAQYALEENGFASHAEWRAAWQRERASQFFLLGSSDEKCSNQSCQLTIDERGRGTLKVRLPDAILQPGEPQWLPLPVRFPHGHEHLCWALESKRVRSAKGHMKYQANAALSFRFQRTRKRHKKTGRPTGAEHWYVHVSVETEAPPLVSRPEQGRLAVDINRDLLALAHLDACGNPLRVWHLPVRLTDRRSAQITAALGEAAREIVAYAAEHRLPIVLERLDFQAKKAQLELSAVPQRRMLSSSFAYRQVADWVRSRARKEGILVQEVNPAYTSVIGRVKFAHGYGLSVHGGAAVAIGRRSQGFNRPERVRGRGIARVPLQNASQARPNARPVRPQLDGVRENAWEPGWKRWQRIGRALKDHDGGVRGALARLTAAAQAPPPP